MENESRLIEHLVPELADAGRLPAATEWSTLLAKVCARIDGIERMNGASSSKLRNDKRNPIEPARLKAELLPEARSYVAKLSPSGARASGPMSEDQTMVLYIAGSCRERWDDLFKPGYLPYWEARPFHDAAVARRRSDASHPLRLLFSGLARPSASVTRRRPSLTAASPQSAR